MRGHRYFHFALSYLPEGANLFFLKEVIDDKHVYEFAKPALHL